MPPIPSLARRQAGPLPGRMASAPLAPLTPSSCSARRLVGSPIRQLSIVTTDGEGGGGPVQQGPTWAGLRDRLPFLRTRRLGIYGSCRRPQAATTTSLSPRKPSAYFDKANGEDEADSIKVLLNLLWSIQQSTPDLQRIRRDMVPVNTRLCCCQKRHVVETTVRGFWPYNLESFQDLLTSVGED